jgi:alanine racemase
VVLTKSVNAGEAVSYNSRFIPDAATHIAIVGTGYSDGLPSQVINPMVLIRGRRFNVVGTICMDMVMVDIGDSTDVEVGDEVVWVGTQDQLTIPMSEFCLKVGKNPREVMCNFGARCQTLFLSGHPAQA